MRYNWWWREWCVKAFSDRAEYAHATKRQRAFNRDYGENDADEARAHRPSPVYYFHAPARCESSANIAPPAEARPQGAWAPPRRATFRPRETRGRRATEVRKNKGECECRSNVNKACRQTSGHRHAIIGDAYWWQSWERWHEILFIRASPLMPRWILPMSPRCYLCRHCSPTPFSACHYADAIDARRAYDEAACRWAAIQAGDYCWYADAERTLSLMLNIIFSPYIYNSYIMSFFLFFRHSCSSFRQYSVYSLSFVIS